MKALAQLLFVAAIIFAQVTAVSANPMEIPLPLPIRSQDELMLALKRHAGPEFAGAVWQAAILGPEYAWLQAELAMREDLSLLIGSVFEGLAMNGDPESLSVLRGVAIDTTRIDYIRVEAVKALAKAGDRDAIPLLEDLAEEARSEFLRHEVVGALDRIEFPWRYRSLFTYEWGFVRFGFLIDDIESVEYFDMGPSRGHCVFASGEYRVVCDLLQAGTGVKPTMMVDPGRLVFRLKDGTEATLQASGALFSGIAGSTVESPRLEEFLLGRVAAASGEPPN